jgi:hypothetical protein
MYGEFIPQYREDAFMEVVGDWTDILNAAKTATETELRVWKSGVVAHAQTHPELGDEKSYGGYGYLGEPHSHFMGPADIPVLGNLETSDPDWETPMPIRHRHGYLFGAATIPKVRPVLLCQKI